MVALQIRDVPDDVRQRLADRAAARGQSLQSFLLALVTQEAQRSGNLAIVQRFADRADGSRLSGAEVTGALDLARAERADRLAALRDPR
jgi:plasmid stability protein